MVKTPRYQRRTTVFADLVRAMSVDDYIVLTDNARERHVRYNCAKKAMPGATFSVRKVGNEYRLVLLSKPAETGINEQ